MPCIFKLKSENLSLSGQTTHNYYIIFVWENKWQILITTAIHNRQYRIKAGFIVLSSVLSKFSEYRTHTLTCNSYVSIERRPQPDRGTREKRIGWHWRLLKRFQTIAAGRFLRQRTTKRAERFLFGASESPPRVHDGSLKSKRNNGAPCQKWRHGLPLDEEREGRGRGRAYNDVHWSPNGKKEIPRESVVSMKHPVQVYVYALK